MKKKQTETLSALFWVIIYITNEFNFMKKNKHFIGLILGNNSKTYNRGVL